MRSVLPLLASVASLLVLWRAQNKGHSGRSPA